jgi:hypothetical protein
LKKKLEISFSRFDPEEIYALSLANFGSKYE